MLRQKGRMVDLKRMLASSCCNLIIGGNALRLNLRKLLDECGISSVVEVILVMITPAAGSEARGGVCGLIALVDIFVEVMSQDEGLAFQNGLAEALPKLREGNESEKRAAEILDAFIKIFASTKAISLLHPPIRLIA